MVEGDRMKINWILILTFFDGYVSEFQKAFGFGKYQMWKCQISKTLNTDSYLILDMLPLWCHHLSIPWFSLCQGHGLGKYQPWSFHCKHAPLESGGERPFGYLLLEVGRRFWRARLEVGERSFGYLLLEVGRRFWPGVGTFEYTPLIAGERSWKTL